MCNCSEHESSGSLSKMTAASVEPAMKPQVPLSRQISFSDEESGDQPAATDLQPFPPFRLCRLDFREGCYQINFRPTAGFVTFEGTLRVDRSAPDGGADHLIVSGDLYSRRPVIGPIPPVGPVVPVGDADEDEAAADSGLTSLAGSLSALDEPLIPFPIRRPRIPIFPRALSFLSQGDQRVRAGRGPAAEEVRADDCRRAVQLHAAAGRPVQGHVPGLAVAHRDDEAF